MSPAANLVNAERVSQAFGTRILLDAVSLGIARGDVIGVVGRNGDGKTTLLDILTGRREPDAGRVTRAGALSLGYLGQTEDFRPDATVRDVIVAGQPDHVWARDAERRAVVADLLGGIGLDARVAELSGGERRRCALVALLFGGHDLLVLDEPTNHLDVEAVAWLARHLRVLQERGTAMLVVSHDRWFLDAVCTRIWEVHDAVVDAYDGGYAAYVLARAERARNAAAREQRRQNLVRKELAWLRRGAPARTSKPKFRIDAATALIADEPEPRDKLGLQKFATARLGKDVFDLVDVDVRLPGGRGLLDDVSWSIGPGDRIGLIGVNGAGKTTLLRLLTGERAPDAGLVKRGSTLRVGHLSQAVAELDGTETVLASVERLKRETRLATGQDATATSLLGDFGFTGDRLTTRVAELSGGERRRLQLLRLLLEEPNVLLLDEPTNDLDIDTLTVIEDHLDTWPGTLIVVSHDRYFLERTCDVIYALQGDGRCVLLPGGIDQFLANRARANAGGARESATPGDAAQRAAGGSAAAPTAVPASPAALRQARKDLARAEQQLGRLTTAIDAVHAEMAAAASDYGRLTELQARLAGLEAERDEREAEWLVAAELLEG